MDDTNINGGREKCRETCHQVEVPSEKEVMALNEMRVIKDRVR